MLAALCSQRQWRCEGSDDNGAAQAATATLITEFPSSANVTSCTIRQRESGDRMVPLIRYSPSITRYPT
eukprot:6207068-Pleurochrysis_carterae.AAC.1